MCMKGKKHNPAPSDATQTVGLPSKARPPKGPIPLIPDYRLIRVIGRGTFGTVWLAEETIAGVFRAIKVLDPPAKTTAADGGGERAPRIDRELDGIHAYQAHTKDHPHLVRILKTGQCTLEEARDPDQSRPGAPGSGAQQHQPRQEQGAAAPASQPPSRQRRTVYYVMEIADHAGGAQPHHTVDYEPLTLATLLRQKHRLPITHATPATFSTRRAGLFSTQRGGLFSGQRAGPSSAPVPPPASELVTAHLPKGSVIDYALSLLDAIEHLHKAGLHHRDVKPSNCLFVGGILKLADVGLTTSDNRERIGTPAYMPPEPVDADPTDSSKTDRSPLALPDDLYALGKTIYQMTTGLPAADYPDWPGDLEPTSDTHLPELRKLINDLCHPQAGKRLSDIREVRHRLAALALQPSVPALSRRRAALIIGLAAAVSFYAGAWTTTRWHEPEDPMSRVYGVWPYSGVDGPEYFEWGGITYDLSRKHRPGATYTLPCGGTFVAFWDIQTRLAEGRLEVSGAFQIYQEHSSAQRDITNPRGIICQVVLCVGDELRFLYHAQPSAKPGTYHDFGCRGTTGIPLSEIVTREDERVAVYLAVSTKYSPREAAQDYDRPHQREALLKQAVQIAYVTRLSAAEVERSKTKSDSQASRE